MAKSVINVGYNSNLLKKAIEKVYSKNFKKILKKSKNPYGNGGDINFK